MTFSRQCCSGAFTKLELLVVLTVVVLLVSLLAFALTEAKAHNSKINCTSNLKQCALSFRLFSGDSTGRFPFSYPNCIALNDTSNAWVHFEAMSNELAIPKVLVCPEDAKRVGRHATDFSTNSTGFENSTNQNAALSYFVGLGASDELPQSILTGDRNLAKTGTAPFYSSKQNGGGIVSDFDSRWSATEGGLFHEYGGNVALADGSVERASDEKLQELLRKAASTAKTNNNWFLFPQ